MSCCLHPYQSALVTHFLARCFSLRGFSIQRASRTQFKRLSGSFSLSGSLAAVRPSSHAQTAMSIQFKKISEKSLLMEVQSRPWDEQAAQLLLNQIKCMRHFKSTSTSKTGIQERLLNNLDWLEKYAASTSSHQRAGNRVGDHEEPAQEMEVRLTVLASLMFRKNPDAHACMFLFPDILSFFLGGEADLAIVLTLQCSSMKPRL